MGRHWQIDSDRARALSRIIEPLRRAGFTARLCGGGVRDRLLGRLPADDDIAIDAQPEEVAETLEAAGLRVVPTGVAHGTVTAVTGGRGFEITTLRRDLQTFGRHAAVHFGDVAWEEDARRRDFTVNALYADLDGTIYDYVDGVADLEAGRVRFVGDPEERIKEDFLRILRLFRFHARFARHPLDATTLDAVRRWAPYLTHISRERVAAEWWALLATERPRAALEAMQGNGVLAVILPEIGAMPEVPQCNPYHDRDVARHSWHTLFALFELEEGRHARIAPDGAVDPDGARTCSPIPRLPLLRHLALFHDLAKPLCHRREGDPPRDRFIGHDEVGARMIERQLRRLGRGQHDRTDMAVMIRRHLYLLKHESRQTHRRLYRQVGARLFTQLLYLALADAAAMQAHSFVRCRDSLLPLLDEVDAWAPPPTLPVSGRDLLHLGVPQGPEVGDLLDRLRDWWEGEEPAPDREACLAWLREHL
ncbi:MAG: CCA tRNA nucleotidyltransferase [Nitrospirota bacterium]|jgi:poly(A) polymerase